MVSFECEDCGEHLEKPNLRKHLSMCSATKEKYGPKKPSNSKREIDFNVNAAVSNGPTWFCSLCNAKTNSEKNFVAHVRGQKHREKANWFEAKQLEQSAVYKDNSNNQPGFERTVGLSKQHRWVCSLCNIKATCEQNLLAHANGNKHQSNVKCFNTIQEQRQAEQSKVNKDNLKQQTKVDTNVGLSATCKQNLLAHANGKKHRENVENFNANLLQQSEQSSMDKKGTIENASNGGSVDLHLSSGVGDGYYTQPEKKRKLEIFNGNEEVDQAEEVEEGGEKKSKSKKAKKQDHEKKKQNESDSDFEYDKEDMKLQLLSYSKEELIYLIYKTLEKGSRLMSTILESTKHDITQRNIVVRGFGWYTTHESLKAAFESYGEIEDCSVVMDKETGRSKGYGFVLFKTRKGAREALKNLEKRMYNCTVVCNLASANPREPAFPRIELDHGHIHEKRHQQLTLEIYDQNMPFYGHSQRPGFDSMYGALRGNHLVTGPPNYHMFGSGFMNHGSVAPWTHGGMTSEYFGDLERTYWYQSRS